MLRSMTAFARSDVRQEWGSLTWEIRTVNSRYLEPHFRLPDALRVHDEQHGVSRLDRVLQPLAHGRIAIIELLGVEWQVVEADVFKFQLGGGEFLDGVSEFQIDGFFAKASDEDGDFFLGHERVGWLL